MRWNVWLVMATVAIAGCPDSGGAELEPPPQKRCRVVPQPPPPRSSPDAGTTDDAGIDMFDPDCAACRQDGQACFFSINCRAGSICNVETEDLFDPERPASVCIRVTCEGDDDCAFGERCDARRICSEATCLAQGDCAASEACVDGRCLPALGPEEVEKCRVEGIVDRIGPGERIRLRGTAFTRCGEPLPEVPLEWSSSSPDVAVVDGQSLVGGAMGGSTRITARVGDVECVGTFEVTNAGEAPGRQTRVIVTRLDGTPIDGARVLSTSVDDLIITEMITSDGVALFPGTDPRSITVIADGYERVSAIEPGDTVTIGLPRYTPPTMSAGVRGSMGAGERRDFGFGFGGLALKRSAPDFGMNDLLCGTAIETVFDAPELGFDNERVSLPGALVMALGNKKFTDDGTGLRCNGDSPRPSELGCFVAEGAPGETTAWAIGGFTRLSRVTSVADALSEALGGVGYCEAGGVVFASLFSGFSSGWQPVTLAAHPKVSREGIVADCSNPGPANYDDLCRGDYAAYEPLHISTAPQAIYTALALPEHPSLPDGGCFESVLGAVGVETDRGFIPLGLSGGFDGLLGARDCRVDGSIDGNVEYPVGTLPISLTPPADLEGRLGLMIAYFAQDHQSASFMELDGYASPSVEAGLSGPAGTITADQIQVTALDPRAELIHVKVGQWSIYAPADRTTVAIPDVPELRAAFVAGIDATLRTITLEGPAWSGSRSLARVRAFASTRVTIE